MSFSAYTSFDRAEWARLRDTTPLTLSQTDLAELQGLNEQLSLLEVVEVYLPLSRLLNLHPRVDLVTTDGFLYPNKVLEERGLMARKGFPESYDRRRLLRFLADLKAGSQRTVVRQPDLLILEGLTVLDKGEARPGDDALFVSDYFDFSIYVDAPEAHIKDWFLQRFTRLRETSFRDPKSYFQKYAHLSDEEAQAFAGKVWDQINGPNLRENILPTRERAHLILEKGPGHEVERVKLRRL